MKKTAFLLLCVGFFQPIFSQKTITTLQVPGLTEFCKIDPKGHSVLPSGRYVTPAGQVRTITRAPFGLSVSPNGKQALRGVKGQRERADPRIHPPRA